MPLTFSLDDDLETQDAGAIEVTLHMADGSRRWCYLMTPTALASCGDRLDGTTVRIHYGAPHMIVVAGRLTEDIVDRVLRRMARAGDIEKCSQALADAEPAPGITP